MITKKQRQTRQPAIPSSPDQPRELADRELKLTAAVYTLHGAAGHLKQTGRLPEKIGGPWSVIPMRHVIEARGVDLELTADEQLVYDAIIRERRLPGGSVCLIDPEGPKDRASHGPADTRRPLLKEDR